MLHFSGRLNKYYNKRNLHNHHCHYHHYLMIFLVFLDSSLNVESESMKLVHPKHLLVPLGGLMEWEEAEWILENSSTGI